jgi:hypothetical protein
MAAQMLLYKTDEVARNGVLGKLRPEVSPGAPLHNWIVDIPLVLSGQPSPDHPILRLKGTPGGVWEKRPSAFRHQPSTPQDYLI